MPLPSLSTDELRRLPLVERLRAAGLLTAAELERARRLERLHRAGSLVRPWVRRGRVPDAEPRAKLVAALEALGRDSGLVVDAVLFDRLDPGDLERFRAALHRL